MDSKNYVILRSDYFLTIPLYLTLLIAAMIIAYIILLPMFFIPAVRKIKGLALYRRNLAVLSVAVAAVFFPVSMIFVLAEEYRAGSLFMENNTRYSTSRFSNDTLSILSLSSPQKNVDAVIKDAYGYVHDGDVYGSPVYRDKVGVKHYDCAVSYGSVVEKNGEYTVPVLSFDCPQSLTK